ncbi:hypothetical protein JJB28_10005, partial [Campylobacter fetus subsp. venerealis]|uniref:hypothetical protein n=1 Tax=Campylobacter fetus TaxID=196 RepID=UPI00190A5B1B
TTFAMSRIVFLILGLVVLQTFAADKMVQQAEKLLSSDIYRIKRDAEDSLVNEAEKLLNRAKRETKYSQPGAEPMNKKIMSLD